MTFLLTSVRSSSDPELQGRDVVLRAPSASDYEEWAQLRAASRPQLEPFEPRWARDELSRTAFRHRLKHYGHERIQDTGYSFFIVTSTTRELVGAITLSNVRRGIAQAASVGYWMGTPYCGRGYMTEAVGVAARYAFQALRLHRLEAGCVPENLASVRVLQKSGFASEGLARSYLKINDVWRDHLLFARLATDQSAEVAR